MSVVDTVEVSAAGAVVARLTGATTGVDCSVGDIGVAGAQ
jgi:hypothetical protein